MTTMVSPQVTHGVSTERSRRTRKPASRTVSAPVRPARVATGLVLARIASSAQHQRIAETHPQAARAKFDQFVSVVPLQAVWRQAADFCRLPQSYDAIKLVV